MKFVKDGVMFIKNTMVRFGQLEKYLKNINLKSKKLTKSDVREINRLLKRGIAQHKIANKFGVTQQMISKIAKKIDWKCMNLDYDKNKHPNGFRDMSKKYREFQPRIIELSKKKNDFEIARELDIPILYVRRYK